ncbi:MAG TPA: hypothetical protein VFV68_01775 [Agriterribacter sp.]|nr:hypothetical protein [Agriterribacter sp.]
MKNLNARLRIFLLLLIAVGNATGQIIISPQLPAAGMVQKKQLWNLLIINHYPSSQELQVLMTMADAGTGQKILAGSSRLFAAARGSTLLSETAIGPLQYQYTGSSAAMNGSDLLMAGRYIVCYTLINNSNTTETPVGEECVNIEVETSAPPQLVAPSDNEMVETHYPNFTWIPPAPVSIVPRLQYAMLLVEVKNGQSAYDAIQRNTPVYLKQYLSSPFLVYPSSGAALEAGKQYAWQVMATSGDTYMQKTEAWSFRVKSDTVAIVIDDHVFPKLGRGYDAHSYICNNLLKFEYNNETGDSSLQVTIYELLNEQQTAVESRGLKMKPGQNFVVMQIGGSGKYKSQQQYLIELKNKRRETWNLRFKYVRKE